MSPLRQTWEITRREFLQRAKSRGFQVMLLVTAGLILALGPALSAISTDAEPIRVGPTAAVPNGSDQAIRQQSAAVDVSIETVAHPTLDAATEGLRSSAVDVVYAGSTIVWLWQLILAMVLVVVFSYLVIRAAARVYRGALLRLGAKVRLRDAWHMTT